jgi:hypothetical protein
MRHRRDIQTLLEGCVLKKLTEVIWDIYNRLLSWDTLLSSTHSHDASSVSPIARGVVAWPCPHNAILWTSGIVDRWDPLSQPLYRPNPPVRSPGFPIWPKSNRHLGHSRLTPPPLLLPVSVVSAWLIPPVALCRPLKSIPKSKERSNL